VGFNANCRSKRVAEKRIGELWWDCAAHRQLIGYSHLIDAKSIQKRVALAVGQWPAVGKIGRVLTGSQDEQDKNRVLGFLILSILLILSKLLFPNYPVLNSQS
jgi:hypothetical protein